MVDEPDTTPEIPFEGASSAEGEGGHPTPPELDHQSIFFQWDATQLDDLFGLVLKRHAGALKLLRQELDRAGVAEVSEADLLRVVRMLRFGTRKPTDFVLLAEVFAGTALEGYVFGDSLATAAFRRALAAWREKRLQARKRRKKRVDLTPPLPAFEEEEPEP